MKERKNYILTCSLNCNKSAKVYMYIGHFCMKKFNHILRDRANELRSIPLKKK